MEKNLLGLDIKCGISVVVCCMNRLDNLNQAVSSWLKIDCIDEIVIIDWSSKVPLTNKTFKDKRIKLYRVSGMKRWILTHAYNLGIRLSSYDKVLKIDSDDIISNNLFLRDIIDLEESFYTGDMSSAYSKDERQFCGVIFAARKNLLLVNGYNEYITSYGYDDIDLYKRLSAMGYIHKKLNIQDFSFLSHSDISRTGSHKLSTIGLILHNKRISNDATMKWSIKSRSQEYEYLGNNNFQLKTS